MTWIYFTNDLQKIQIQSINCVKIIDIILKQILQINAEQIWMRQ